MKFWGKVFGIVFAGFLFVTVLGLFTGREYLQHKQIHYLGTSEISDNQVASVIRSYYSDDSVEGKIFFSDSLDNSISITYDFYSSEEISYLDKKQFSYFDAPLFHSLLEGLGSIPISLIFLGLLLTFFYFAQSHTKKSQLVYSNMLWGMYHPFAFLKAGKPPKTLFVPNVTKDIKINTEKSGIIAVRSFKYLEKDGYLYSAGAGQSRWKTKILESNKKPTEKNSNGCYAYRLVILNEQVYVKQVMAIVSLRGDFCEHADGIIRAEQCEILHLFVDSYYTKYAEKLSQYYGVPVTITENTLRTYSDWLSSENGIECLRHNTEILKDKELCLPTKK